jgi:F0F1-type ATP synthase assembly protein I
MIPLLLTLLVLVILWFAVKTLFASRNVGLVTAEVGEVVIDLVFLVVALVIVLRWAGLL